MGSKPSSRQGDSLIILMFLSVFPNLPHWRLLLTL
jgi:hypothetical protein